MSDEGGETAPFLGIWKLERTDGLYGFGQIYEAVVVAPAAAAALKVDLSDRAYYGAASWPDAKYITVTQLGIATKALSDLVRAEPSAAVLCFYEGTDA